MLPSKVVRQGWGNVVVMQCCVHQVDTYDISCVIFMVSTLYVFQSSISSTCTLLHDLVISYDIQGGGGSFKNRKRIGEIDCCE